MPVDFKEYLSDESTDSESSYDYRNTVSPPTPPRPRPHAGEGAYRVISDHDDNLDISLYFLDADPDDDWIRVDGIDELSEDIGYLSDDIYMSNDDSLMSDSANFTDISCGVGDSSI